MAPETDDPRPPADEPEATPEETAAQQPPEGAEDAPPEEPIAPDEGGRSQPEEPDTAGGGDVPAAEADASSATPDLPDQPSDEAVDQPATPEAGDIPEPGPTPDEAQEATDEMVAAGDDIAAPSDDEAAGEEAEEFIEEQPREKPAIPGAHLEVDIVLEGSDPLGEEAIEGGIEDIEVPVEEPLVTEADVATEPEPDTPAQAVIDLGADARYRATGKRKTAVARVILRPGNGRYTVNGRPLDEHFPRPALQRNIRQPLETVGYDARMDVTATIHGGGVSSQAGALRHGISRALIEADPNLRGELKRRGFLTRDPRVKERKKAGLKKARKRPQFSKR